MNKVLIIDDELTENTSPGMEIGQLLRSHGLEALFAQTWEEPDRGKKAKDFLIDSEGKVNRDVELVLLDIIFRNQKLGGQKILENIKQINKELPVIMLTVKRDIEDALKAFRFGADDYIVKSEKLDEILFKIETTLHAPKIKNVIGFVEEPSKRIFSDIRRAAETDIAVFIQGETGTGKELVANAIHHFSRRAEGDFVPIYCGGLAETLLESELFGHKRGAFTGATTDKRGLFEIANEGTLFLDEMCDVPLPTQVKLLRAIQEGEIRRVGETQIRKVNVRIISATNRDVSEEVRRGNFRKDLFYRLFGYPIYLPPLRERKEDISVLAGYFISKYNKKYEADIENVENKVVEIFKDYEWTGNIRELESVIERCVILDKDKKVITEETASALIQQAKSLVIFGTSTSKVKQAAELIKAYIFEEKRSLDEVCDEMKKEIVQSVYDACNRNVSRTAEVLYIEGQRTSLKKKYELQ